MKKEHIQSAPSNESGHVLYGPAVTPGLINDLRDIYAEMEPRENDDEEVCIRVPDGRFHQAAIVGIVVDALTKFKNEGFYVSNAALRVLTEQCGIPCEIIGQPTEPTTPNLLENLEELPEVPPEEPGFEDAESIVEVISFSKQRTVYNERRHEQARTANDLW